eukprot:CAMPEP_0174252382 /NCGR_PEP_ID=MMETSP0439-20130205/1873_1 /TAXON_ID=0 /ORGANISM="Stereomyxa ramosa, Strain Chinc5" /LENGTH=722 /DNA_ID=CAMNT_0015332905 /DNA_START=206 /DNA_END=2375 /DNA_ORIENTATION=+
MGEVMKQKHSMTKWDVKGMIVRSSITKMGKHLYAFDVYTSGAHIIMAADSDILRREWISQIGDAADNMDKEQFDSPQNSPPTNYSFPGDSVRARPARKTQKDIDEDLLQLASMMQNQRPKVFVNTLRKNDLLTTEERRISLKRQLSDQGLKKAFLNNGNYPINAPYALSSSPPLAPTSFTPNLGSGGQFNSAGHLRPKRPARNLPRDNQPRMNNTQHHDPRKLNTGRGGPSHPAENRPKKAAWLVERDVQARMNTRRPGLRPLPPISRSLIAGHNEMIRDQKKVETIRRMKPRERAPSDNMNLKTQEGRSAAHTFSTPPPRLLPRERTNEERSRITDARSNRNCFSSPNPPHHRNNIVPVNSHSHISRVNAPGNVNVQNKAPNTPMSKPFINLRQVQQINTAPAQAPPPTKPPESPRSRTTFGTLQKLNPKFDIRERSSSDPNEAALSALPPIPASRASTLRPDPRANHPLHSLPPVPDRNNKQKPTIPPPQSIFNSARSSMESKNKINKNPITRKWASERTIKDTDFEDNENRLSKHFRAAPVPPTRPVRNYATAPLKGKAGFPQTRSAIGGWKPTETQSHQTRRRSRSLGDEDDASPRSDFKSSQQLYSYNDSVVPVLPPEAYHNHDKANINKAINGWGKNHSNSLATKSGESSVNNNNSTLGNVNGRVVNNGNSGVGNNYSPNSKDDNSNNIMVTQELATTTAPTHKDDNNSNDRRDGQ